jgi:hypothetical protein
VRESITAKVLAYLWLPMISADKLITRDLDAEIRQAAAVVRDKKAIGGNGQRHLSKRRWVVALVVLIGTIVVVPIVR